MGMNPVAGMTIHDNVLQYLTISAPVRYQSSCRYDNPQWYPRIAYNTSSHWVWILLQVWQYMTIYYHTWQYQPPRPATPSYELLAREDNTWQCSTIHDNTNSGLGRNPPAGTTIHDNKWQYSTIADNISYPIVEAPLDVWQYMTMHYN